MNKKTLRKLDLEESVAREATADDCPTCKQHFNCALSMEAHKKLYPKHFSGEAPPVESKKEAVLVPLKAKVTKEKKR